MTFLIRVWCFLVLLASWSCTSFRYVEPTISPETLPAECDGLTEWIKDNWKQHKTLAYYQGDNDFLTVLQGTYQACLLQLQKSDVIALLGQPTENEEAFYMFYHLREGCTVPAPVDCKILTFHFREDSGLLFAVGVEDQIAYRHNE